MYWAPGPAVCPPPLPNVTTLAQPAQLHRLAQPGQAGPKLLHHNQPAIQPELRKENLEFNSNINSQALASLPACNPTRIENIAKGATNPGVDCFDQ